MLSRFRELCENSAASRARAPQILNRWPQALMRCAGARLQADNGPVAPERRGRTLTADSTTLEIR